VYPNSILFGMSEPFHSSRCQNVVINMLRYSSGIIVSKKNTSTANARCLSEQHCMMTEGFKPLYPAMCASPHHLQRCRHGTKCKSFNSVYENDERYQLDATIVIYYHKYLYMFWAPICPSSGVQVVCHCIWCSAP